MTWCLVFAVGCCRGMSIEGPRQALVNIKGKDISGRIMLEQASITSPVKIRGTILGLETGVHGVAVHAGSQLGSGCRSVGAQFVPADRYDSPKPAGYLGNVKVDDDLHQPPVTVEFQCVGILDIAVVFGNSFAV